MMIWEGSKDPIVKLCVEFRKAVVAELSVNPELSTKILGAFKEEELAEFDRWSKEALSQSLSLQQQSANGGTYNPATLAKLDQIVLDMSEKSAECALRVIGQNELQSFVKKQDRTAATSEAYKARNYPHLARIFAP